MEKQLGWWRAMLSLRNDRGFTLVELLATLVIAGIILSFVGSLMVKAVNSYDRSAAENSLRDEADIIMARIHNDVFPLTSEKVTSLTTSCTDPITQCTTGAWLVIDNDTSKRIGYAGNEILLLDGNYTIQNPNVKIVDFKVCFIAPGGTVETANCHTTTTTDYPTYVFKLTLENEKKSMTTQFTNEISIIYNN
jgi:prepilin-type N-terminal cleavage/methylation domain-containing protein